MSTPSYFDEVFDGQDDISFDKPTKPVEEEEAITVEEETLLTRGFFTSVAQVGTNDIVLRTLKVGEELEVALLVSRYQNTIEATRALITATVAAAITSVNGLPLMQGLGPESESLEAKFNYIARN